eukprot:COSAG03_NODE_537_length_7096_cov_15.736744_2_plen_156_part_00
MMVGTELLTMNCFWLVNSSRRLHGNAHSSRESERHTHRDRERGRGRDFKLVHLRGVTARACTFLLHTCKPGGVSAGREGLRNRKPLANLEVRAGHRQTVPWGKQAATRTSARKSVGPSPSVCASVCLVCASVCQRASGGAPGFHPVSRGPKRLCF